MRALTDLSLQTGIFIWFHIGKNMVASGVDITASLFALPSMDTLFSLNVSTKSGFTGACSNIEALQQPKQIYCVG